MNIDIQELRKQYYKSISLLQNKEDIINALPTPSYKNFFVLIDGLLDLLNKDFDSYNDLLGELDENSDDYLLASELLENTKLKIEICMSLINEASKKNDDNEIVTSDKKIDFIFAKSGFGSIKALNDLKGIPEEYYYSIYEFFEMIHNRENFDNKDKIRKLSGNDKIDCIYEAKPFKVRILFKFLDQDTVYIFGIRAKKADNDSIDRKQVIEKFSSCRREYEQLLEDIKVKRGELVAEHMQYKNQMYDYLENNYRGNKKFGR